MKLTDKEEWLRSCETWNALLLSAPWAVDFHKSIAAAIEEGGCFYRFSREKFESRQAVVSNSIGRRRNRFSHSINGIPIVESPIATALRPALLPFCLEERLTQIGKNLETVLELSNKFIQYHPETLALFGDPRKGEFFATTWNTHLSPVMQMVRVDFLWRWVADEPVMKLVDVNLLPGMTFINERLAAIFTRESNQHKMPSLRPAACGFNASRLLDSIIDHFVCASSNSRQAINLAVLVREFHGLGADAELCASRLSQALGRHVQTMTPIGMVEEDFQHGEMQTGRVGFFDGLVRMARPVSKHRHPSLQDREDCAFEEIVHRLSAPWQVFPAFNAYLENHAWFYLWQSRLFEALANECGYLEQLRELQQVLPRTSIVDGSGALLSTENSRPLLASDLKNRVIKIGNSTGGQDLAILERASSGQLGRARSMIEARLSAGWIVQELVENQKETFPVCQDDATISLVNGYMTHAAYFSNGKMLGCHALMTPSSRKVHGGFETLLIPIMFI